jgi:hypothetical protein
MRTRFALLAVLGLLLLLVGDAPGQRGFVPRPPPIRPPAPPVRPVIAPHVPPLVPPVPHRPLTRPHTGHGNAPPQSPVRDEAHLRDLAIIAAGTVGLLPAADGHGALLAGAALVGREASHPRAPEPLPAHVGGGGAVAQPALAVPGANIVGWCVAAAIGLMVVIVGIALATRRGVPSGRLRVRIVGAPPGEAPDHVRRAWIGLELPLAPGQSGPRRVPTEGVVTGQRDYAMDGYLILGSEAVRLLATHDAEAALWWRTHAPHVLSNGYLFVFPPDVCDPV